MNSWHRHLVTFVVVSACVAASATGCKSNTIDNQTNNSSNSAGINVVGPQGGIVLGPEGSSVRIPAGALTKDETISIRVADPGQYPPLPGTYNTLSKVFAFEPHGLKFLTPAIITIPFTSDGTPSAQLTGIRAEGTQTSTDTSSWQPIQAQIAVDAQISTPGFSYYAIAKTAGGPTSTSNSCSGRGPDNGAATGALQNMTGTYKYGPSQTPMDLSKLVDGVAYYGFNPDGSGSKNQLTLKITSYTKACGYVKNNVMKIGTNWLTVNLNDASPITTKTYTTNLNFGAAEIPASATAGQCGAGADGGGSAGALTPGLTITAIDANHVAGTFDATPPGQSRLTGTFDLPFCNYAPNTPSCCVP